MDTKEVWGCVLMSGVRMRHFLKDWLNFIQIHQYYTMALIPIQKYANISCESYPFYILQWYFIV